MNPVRNFGYMFKNYKNNITKQISKGVKIIFFGTSEFAAPMLETLIKSEKYLISAVTAPDSPAGRQKVITASPIKSLAQKFNLDIIQEENIKNPNFIQKIKDLKPDLIVIVAFGKIIPQEIINIPRFGALNIHPSLLPKYRGPSPIQNAILNGESKTGVSFMMIDQEMDHGPILTQFEALINHNDDYLKLSFKLSELAKNKIINVLEDYLNGRIQPQNQDHEKATFTKILKREDGLIDWSRRANFIERQIRAYEPWPGVFTFFKKNDKKIRLKILETKIREGNGETPGLVNKTDNGFEIKTGKDWLIILKVQPESSRIMSAQEFLRGYPKIIGQNLTKN
ncbi:MAG: methionyl-tRNA formyltransferase [Parcubacteria group bacterium]|nr:methionyl-tRNA formyltransferase [Parcubacteria group bacterium]